MIPRITSKLGLAVMTAFFYVALPVALYSQEQDDQVRREEEERQKLEAQQRAEQEINQQRVLESREAFVNEARKSAELAVETFNRNARPIDREFASAVPAFRKAVSELKDAVGDGLSLQKPLKDIDKLIRTFHSYFKTTHLQGVPPDKAEFNDFSQKNLASETVTSAERIDTKLHQAAALIQASNRTNAITVQTMLFLRDLHSDLLRLDVLMKKLK